jgi:hypothetical protein
MSRAFVKESEGDVDLPDRPVSEHPNDVTQDGLALIDAALLAAQVALAAGQVSGDRASIANACRDLRYWSSRRAAEISSGGDSWT